MSGTRRPGRTGALAATVVPAVLGALLLSACAAGGQASGLTREQASRDAATPTTEAAAPASVQVAGSTASPSARPTAPRRTDAATGSGEFADRPAQERFLVVVEWDDLAGVLRDGVR